MNMDEETVQKQTLFQRGSGSGLCRRISNAERFHCTSPSINMNEYCELMNFLPKDYQYHVCSYASTPKPCGDHASFEATIRLPLETKEEVLVWLKSMPVTWRVSATRPSKGQKVLFRSGYRCQHNTQRREPLKPGRVSKNTDCPARLKVALSRTKNGRGERSRSTDPHMPAFPTIVEIWNIHNHNIYTPDALRHKDVGSEAVERLTALFEAGLSPAGALDVLKANLRDEYGDAYESISEDRSLCPDLSFCYRLYERIFKTVYEVYDELDDVSGRIVNGPEMGGHRVHDGAVFGEALNTSESRPVMKRVVQPPADCEDGVSDGFCRCFCQLYAGQPCHTRFTQEELQQVRLQYKRLSRQALDIAILSKLSCGMNLPTHEESKLIKQTERKILHIDYYHHGYRICRHVFKYLHGIGQDKLKALIKHYKIRGVVPRVTRSKKNHPSTVLEV